MAGNSRKRKTKNKSGGRLDFGSVSLSLPYHNWYHFLSTAADDRRSQLVLHFAGVILCGKPCAGDLFFYSGIAPCCAPQTRQEERRVRVYVFTGFSTCGDCLSFHHDFHLFQLSGILALEPYVYRNADSVAHHWSGISCDGIHGVQTYHARGHEV